MTDDHWEFQIKDNIDSRLQWESLRPTLFDVIFVDQNGDGAIGRREFMVWMRESVSDPEDD